MGCRSDPNNKCLLGFVLYLWDVLILYSSPTWYCSPSRLKLVLQDYPGVIFNPFIIISKYHEKTKTNKEFILLMSSVCRTTAPYCLCICAIQVYYPLKTIKTTQKSHSVVLRDIFLHYNTQGQCTQLVIFSPKYSSLLQVHQMWPLFHQCCQLCTQPCEYDPEFVRF